MTRQKQADNLKFIVVRLFLVCSNTSTTPPPLPPPPPPLRLPLSPIASRARVSQARPSSSTRRLQGGRCAPSAPASLCRCVTVAQFNPRLDGISVGLLATCKSWGRKPVHPATGVCTASFFGFLVSNWILTSRQFGSVYP